MEKVIKVVSENGVVIFSKSSCCMCYAVMVLFHELGVVPLIYTVDHDPEGREMERSLARLGCTPTVPAVFISGEMIGSTTEVMSRHLSGTLVRLLRPYQR